MENNSKFKDLAAGIGKSAKSIFDNAVLSADQNDDGKFDMEDVSAIAESMNSSIKKGVLSLKETADEKARQMEFKALQPIFLHDLDSANFLMPKFIRIAERDKRRAESEVVKTPLVMVPTKRDYISSIFLEIPLMLLYYLFIQTVIVNSIMLIPLTEIVISP